MRIVIGGWDPDEETIEGEAPWSRASKRRRGASPRAPRLLSAIAELRAPPKEFARMALSRQAALDEKSAPRRRIRVAAPRAPAAAAPPGLWGHQARAETTSRLQRDSGAWAAAPAWEPCAGAPWEEFRAALKEALARWGAETEAYGSQRLGRVEWPRCHASGGPLHRHCRNGCRFFHFEETAQVARCAVAVLAGACEDRRHRHVHYGGVLGPEGR